MIPQSFLQPSWQSSSAFHALATARVTVAGRVRHSYVRKVGHRSEKQERDSRRLSYSLANVLQPCSSHWLYRSSRARSTDEPIRISRRPASIESRNQAFSMLALSNPLPLLGPHLGVFAGSTVGFIFLQWASATFSPRFFPVQFATFTARNKRGWDSHVVCPSLNVYESLR